jgi:hypothetical protein
MVAKPQMGAAAGPFSRGTAGGGDGLRRRTRLADRRMPAAIVVTRCAHRRLQFPKVDNNTVLTRTHEMNLQFHSCLQHEFAKRRVKPEFLFRPRVCRPFKTPASTAALRRHAARIGGPL